VGRVCCRPRRVRVADESGLNWNTELKATLDLGIRRRLRNDNDWKSGSDLMRPFQDRQRRERVSTQLPLPANDTLLCLIPRGDMSPYTSVLACSRDGKLRFWDHLSVGVDRFRSGEVIVLGEDEAITTMENSEVRLLKAPTNSWSIAHMKLDSVCRCTFGHQSRKAHPRDAPFEHW
jgi:hypothetical protein